MINVFFCHCAGTRWQHKLGMHAIEEYACTGASRPSTQGNCRRQEAAHTVYPSGNRSQMIRWTTISCMTMQSGLLSTVHHSECANYDSCRPEHYFCCTCTVWCWEPARLTWAGIILQSSTCLVHVYFSGACMHASRTPAGAVFPCC